MKGKRGLICLFLLVFFVFFLDIINGFRERQTIGENNFVQLTSDKVSYYDRFSKELVIVLAEILPDKQSFDAVCQSAYLQEEDHHDEIIIALYLIDDSGKKLLIWCVEANRLKKAKAMKVLARDAAYILLYRFLLYRLSEEAPPAISIPVKKLCCNFTNPVKGLRAAGFVFLLIFLYD